MLYKLFVSNFALIRKTEIEFQPGLTVITGETGSGKSILLGALKLILGERADFSVIRNKDKKTIVEAEIKLNKERFKDFFKKNELDFWKETILRREIHAKGKSRAFINDTPVSLAILKELTANLIHIHSQHNTIQLKSKNFQRELLDVYAENNELFNSFQREYAELQELKKSLKAKKENYNQQLKEHDFLLFQLEELSKLNLNNVNFQEKESKLSNLQQIDEIRATYARIINTLEDDQSSGVIDRLKFLENNVTVENKEISELKNRLSSVVIELDDINAEASSQLEGISDDPEEEELLTAQLDAYNSALRKHNAINQEQLLEIYHEIDQKVADFNNAENAFSALENNIIELEKSLLDKASVLSKRRVKFSKELSNQIRLILNDLKMTDAKVEIVISRKEMSENGIDDIAFLFSPNKGLEPLPIEKAASGGELSRLMLAIHYILSGKQKLPTVIFDEIDTGVSGEVASKIGKHLRKMGENMQLLAITHLPQVAASGQHHLTVSKNDLEDETISRIEKIDKKRRVEELAKLMSGEEINQAAIENAETLLKNQI